MTTQAQRRDLRFANYDAIIADVRQLHEGGYTRLGNWSLGQTCGHLCATQRIALDGFGFFPSWPIRPFMRWVMLPRFERNGRFPSGMPTPKSLLPPPADDEPRQVAAFIELTEKIRDHGGPWQPSPLFGNLGHDGWQRLNAVHASHHLSLLIPNGPKAD